MSRIETTLSLSDLRNQPVFFNAAADRIWQSWWKQKGLTKEEFREKFKSVLGVNPIPTAFIAHQSETYLGNALLIENDFLARPKLTPWVAAVWTEEQHRNKGIATALINRAVQYAFDLGYANVYLCASIERTPFYKRIGWSVSEYNVQQLNVLIQENPQNPSMH